MPIKEFDRNLFESVCSRMCEGISLRRAAREHGTRHSSFLGFLSRLEGKEKSECEDLYARAREELIEFRHDELDEIVDAPPQYVSVTGKDGESTETRIDPAWVALQRLRHDARKWDLTKLAPHKYGDKVAVEHSGEIKTRLVRDYGK